jgi:hypothetical protein
MARWHSCNVLQVTADARRLWHFDARNGSFTLNRELTARPDEPLPAGLVGKSWSALWQPKLNVAWLSPEEVFIRVAQFPRSSPEETRAMVELQLEKLSPIPVTQAVWTMQVLQPPKVSGDRRETMPAGSENKESKADAMQTVVVTFVARSVVEELLGRLEGQGFLADRLEVPLLDQLESTVVTEDGAWIYPIGGGRGVALVAWWYHGVLRNLALLTVAAGAEEATGLKDQLLQMAWAGELEGWLDAAPRWHLVCEPDATGDWEPMLRRELEQPVELVAPVPVPEQAALTARRAAAADPKINLLPVEFSTRYRQKFVDRLWLRGLLAALALYGVACLIYFVALSFLNYQAGKVEKEAAALGPTYTNVLQLKALYGVLKERKELTYAALDCWEKTAEVMPEGLTLEALNFSDGKKLTLSGTAVPQQVGTANDFSSRLRKATVDGQLLFNPNSPDATPSTRVAGNNATWSFGLDLKRGEAP